MRSKHSWMSSLPGLRISMAMAVICLVFNSTLALACNIPVFRYALEHWQPDPYRAVVFHRGELSPEHAGQLSAWELEEEGVKANVQIRRVDVDQLESPADRALFEHCQSLALPCLVVQYPASLRVERPVWVGVLSELPFEQLVDSPIRRDLLKRLANGQTAVWIFLESGDAAQDAAALEILSAELDQLEKSLKLPELTDSPEDVLLGGPDLRIDFSIVRVPRDGEGESALSAMLLAAESDLSELREPMVFPVFGRGRAMLPLVGPGISPENIRGSAAFLVGACSCQVKELNPGFDLLASADWEELIPWKPSATSSVGSQEVLKPELIPIPRGSAGNFGSEEPPLSDTEPLAATTDSQSATATTTKFPKRTPVLPLLGALVLVGIVIAMFVRR